MIIDHKTHFKNETDQHPSNLKIMATSNDTYTTTLPLISTTIVDNVPFYSLPATHYALRILLGGIQYKNVYNMCT